MFFRTKAARTPDRFPGTLVHIHIPKTAGRSLNTMLRKLYLEDAQLDATDEPIQKKLRDMTAQDRARLKLVAGHFSYGVHRSLSGPVRLLWILRDPGPRILSLYKYIHRTRKHPMHRAVNARKGGLGGFLELAEHNLGLQTEIFAGQMRRIGGDLTPKALGQEQEL